MIPAIIITYLVSGLLVLVYMYRFNPKVKEKIKDAPYELFDRFSKKGTFVSLRTAKIIMYPVIWLFWVFILVGMVKGKYENNRKHRINKSN